MRRLRDIMTWPSFLRYLLWRAMQKEYPVQIELKSGERFFLRPSPASDLSVACELFLDEAYRIPPSVRLPSHPRVVVDAGANVGLALVLLSCRFPAAQLIAYEPHSGHVAMIRQQVSLNKMSNRVQIVTAAISNHGGTGYLLSAESQSQVFDQRVPQATEVPFVDFLAEHTGNRIDFLKLDIEGGEYAILGDERFASLDIGCIALEWHNTLDFPNGQAWCASRFQSMGYQVADGAIVRDMAGIMWAWR